MHTQMKHTLANLQDLIHTLAGKITTGQTSQIRD